MLSQTAEYALRAVVCLSVHRDQPLTSQQIAVVTCVPAGYLAKVLQALARSGIVRSQRGLHGGFMLGEDPQNLTILKVVSAVDSVKRIHSCPLGLRNHDGVLCPLHRRLDNLMSTIERALGNDTIADLICEADQPRPLCDLVQHSRRPQGRPL